MDYVWELGFRLGQRRKLTRIPALMNIYILMEEVGNTQHNE